MIDAANYFSVETLRDGRQIEIRSFKPGDRLDLEAAAKRLSPLTLYRRFFAPKRSFSEKERQFFLNVDFKNHVALVAWLDEKPQKAIVGGARYVTVRPGEAEIAFVVVDGYQGLGIGGALMRHLIVIAKASGLGTLIAEVLAENISMLKVFEKSQLEMTTRRESGVVHVALRLQ